MADPVDPRARLETQAAAIVGKARADAAEIVRKALHEADEIRRDANKFAADQVGDSHAVRDQARREVVQAQEQALSIRSEAQRTADSLIERATLRARAEADDLLAEARRQLARAVADARSAEADTRRAREELEAIRAEIHHARAELAGIEAYAVAAIEAAASDAIASAAIVAQAEAEAHMAAGDPLPRQRSGISAYGDDVMLDLSGDAVDAFVTGAVHVAVRRAMRGSVTRAGQLVVKPDPFAYSD